ncbi:MAG TPA: hypothetical protein VGL05_27200 [Kribbella sp.]
MRAATAALAAVAVCVATSGCESGAEKVAEKQLASAQRQVQCTTAAKAVSLPATGVPANLPLPPMAVIFHLEDRGRDGLVVSAVTTTSFKDVLAAMNAGYSVDGFKITGGETEKHDAEANWTGDGYRGRWAIREIGAQCPGETLVSILVAHV